MNQKEKAEDLWFTYYELLPNDIYSNEAAKQKAKKFALVAIKELIIEEEYRDGNDGYWKQVKTEIEKL